jgi:hypothetical protein
MAELKVDKVTEYNGTEFPVVWIEFSRPGRRIGLSKDEFEAIMAYGREHAPQEDELAPTLLPGALFPKVEEERPRCPNEGQPCFCTGVCQRPANTATSWTNRS